MQRHNPAGEGAAGQALLDGVMLRCVKCDAAGTLALEASCYRCRHCGAGFGIAEGRVNFLRDDGVFPEQPPASSNRQGGLGRLRAFVAPHVPQASTNLSQARTLRRMGKTLQAKTSPVVLVVGCGRQGEVLRRLLDNSGIQLILTDIGPASDALWLCDAHKLPLADETVDAIITTAVLEHVARPSVAVCEMHRVLKPDGLVYSEIPFMQQVHEGAYDFTRYSLTGHRLLFQGFHEDEAGMVAGPGTALIWAIEYFAMAFFRAPLLRGAARLVARMLFFWLKYFDHLLAGKPFAMDGASCTFFYGRKSEMPTATGVILARYGAGPAIRP